MTQTIEREELDNIMDFVSENVNANVDLREDYSGRGMYGKECVGITTDGHSTELMGVLAVALSTIMGVGYTLDVIADAKIDNMGLGYIVYFPQLQVEDDGYDHN